MKEDNLLNTYKPTLYTYLMVIFTYLIASIFGSFAIVPTPSGFGWKEVGVIALLTYFMWFFIYLFWFLFKIFQKINDREFADIMVFSMLTYFLLLIFLSAFTNELFNPYIALYVGGLNIVAVVVIYLKVKSNIFAKKQKNNG